MVAPGINQPRRESASFETSQLKCDPSTTIDQSTEFAIDVPEKRSVRFSDKSHVYDVPSLFDFSNEEIENTYYSSSEKRAMRMDVKTVLKRMQRGEYRKEEEDEHRIGLGRYLNPNARMRNRRHAWGVVLNYQRRSLDDSNDSLMPHDFDVEFLAKSYQACSMHASRTAHIRALEICQDLSDVYNRLDFLSSRAPSNQVMCR